MWRPAHHHATTAVGMPLGSSIAGCTADCVILSQVGSMHEHDRISAATHSTLHRSARLEAA